MSVGHQKEALFSDLLLTSDELVSCPECGGTSCRRARRRGAIERGPLRWIRLRPARCSDCGARFYARAKPLLHLPREEAVSAPKPTGAFADEELARIVEKMKESEARIAS